MSKYDCSKILDYIHECKRLCDLNIECITCLLYKEGCIDVCTEEVVNESEDIIAWMPLPEPYKEGE